MGIGGLPARVSLCEGIRSSGTGDTDNCELPMWFLKVEPFSQLPIVFSSFLVTFLFTVVCVYA